MKKTEVRVPELVRLLEGKETICTDQLQALIEKAQKPGVTEEMSRSILQPKRPKRPKRTDILGIDAVVSALAGKGIKIELTPAERERYNYVPFSEETLKMAAGHQWRGKRAILWWAPPERYGLTMLKLKDAFGTSTNVQPCVWNNNWWLKEKFAKKVLKEGWHLTLAELPDESRDKTYDDQKALLTKEEELLTPVEVMYLCLVNYLVNDGERLLYNCYSCYSRTDTLDSCGYVVDLGGFGPGGLFALGRWRPTSRGSSLGVLAARKFD